MESKIKQSDKSSKMEKVCNMRHGSHLYGLATENSDVDYKGIFIPDVNSLILGNSSHEIRDSTGPAHGKNSSGDVDTVFYSLQKFIKMACDGETIALDMIHCNDENLLESSDIWKEIVANRDKFYTKNMKAFLGYCRKQAAKYGVKGSRLAAMESVLNCLLDAGKELSVNSRLTDPIVVKRLNIVAHENAKYVKVLDGFEKGGKWIDKRILQVCDSKYDMNCTVEHVVDQLDKKYKSYGQRAQDAKENKGIDWKAISHALRAGYQLKEIYETGDLTYPLKEREFLLKVKNGELDFTTEVSPFLENVIDDVERLAADSSYPERVNRKFWDNFIVDVYNKHVLGGNTK